MKIDSILLTLGFFLVVGMPLTAMGGSLPGADADGDSITDNVDNCLGLGNPTQDDDDHDGCGNACDNLTCDVDGNGVVGAGDFNTISTNWNTTPGAGCTPNCGTQFLSQGDCDGNGIIGAGDFNALSSEWNQSTGPSAVVVRDASCKP